MFTRFLDEFSDEDLAIVWKYSGLGAAMPEYPGQDAFPGRSVMAKFLQPILTPLRDLLRRAVRKMGTRAKLSMLRALLRTLLLARRRPAVRLVLPTPDRLTSQLLLDTTRPVRGSPAWPLGPLPGAVGEPRTNTRGPGRQPRTSWYLTWRIQPWTTRVTRGGRVGPPCPALPGGGRHGPAQRRTRASM